MQRRRVPRFYDVAAFGILFNTSDSTGSMDRANFADSRAYLVELLVTKFCACVGVGICANDCVFVPAISGCSVPFKHNSCSRVTAYMVRRIRLSNEVHVPRSSEYLQSVILCT